MKKQQINKLNHCVFNLTYHLVLVTKFRRKCITAPMLARLNTISTEIAEKWHCELLEFNGEADHLHLLLSLNPKVTPSIFVNNLKTVTSRLIRKEFATHLKKIYWKKPVFWSRRKWIPAFAGTLRAYCILTCGGAPLSIIKQYIEQQDAPHSS
jgi:putative transposase